MADRTWQCQVRTPPGRSPCLTSPTPIWRLRVRGRQRAGASHGGDPVPRRTRRHIGGCGGPAPGHGEPPRAGGGSFSVPGRVGRAEIDHACDREHPGTVVRRRLRARAPAASRPAHGPMTTGRLDRLAVDRGWRCVEVGAADGSVALACRAGRPHRARRGDGHPLFASSTFGTRPARGVPVTSMAASEETTGRVSYRRNL